MANIFSGILNPGAGAGGVNSSEHAYYKQQLSEYDEARLRQKRLADIASMAHQFEAATANMTPERQAQMKLSQMMAASHTMGDKGMEVMTKNLGQRGQTIVDTQQADLQRKTHEHKRLFDIANPKPENDPDIVAATKWYMGDDWDKATLEERQQAMRDVKRQRQLVDVETGYVDPYNKKNFISKNLIQAGVDKKRAPVIAERLNSFYDDVNQTEFFLENTQTQRERVQHLYRNAEGNTGWFALAASIPDIKSEGGSREWQQIRDTVVSNIGLDKILDLKASSAQGATGLGALNEKELEMLQKHKGSLEQANSPEALKRVLLQMDRDMDLLQKRRMRSLQRERAWYNRNKRYAGEKAGTPDLIPEAQEYLFSGDKYTPIRGESPLVDTTTDEDLINKWNK